MIRILKKMSYSISEYINASGPDTLFLTVAAVLFVIGGIISLVSLAGRRGDSHPSNWEKAGWITMAAGAYIAFMVVVTGWIF